MGIELLEWRVDIGQREGGVAEVAQGTAQVSVSEELLQAQDVAAVVEVVYGKGVS